MNKKEVQQLEAFLDMPEQIIEQMAHAYNVLSCPHHGYCRETLYNVMRDDITRNYNSLRLLNPISKEEFDKRYRTFEAAIEDINRNRPELLIENGLPLFLKDQAH